MQLLKNLQARRAAVAAKRQTILDNEEKRIKEAREANPEAPETLSAEADAEIRSLSAELQEIDERIIEVAEEEQRAAAAAKAAGAIEGVGSRVSVRSEPLTYERGNVQASYFGDLARSLRGDPQAADRVSRHYAEMRVEMPKFEARAYSREAAERGLPEGSEFEVRTNPNRTDGTGGEFVPPLWMMEEYIKLQRAGRVTADLCQRRPLPGGTDSINLPKVSTGTAVAAQTADAASVQSTDMTTTSVVGAVQTLAGQQDVSVQLVEQSPLMFDEVIFQDLAGDYAQKLGAQVLTGSGSNGQVRGFYNIASVNTQTYTDGSPTVPELYPKIAGALNNIATTRYLPAEAIIMHPRRWYWILAALDSSNRPLAVPNTQGPNNALATQAGVQSEGPAGWILGAPVYLDPNTPATFSSGTGTGGTEDGILVTRPSDAWLFEGSIRTRALQEVLSGTLQIRFQLYNYVAFIPHRYASSTSVVTGTGLAAPSF